MKYKVFITESRTYSTEVEADSKEQAEEEVRRQIEYEDAPEAGGVYDTTINVYTSAEVSNWERPRINE